MLLGGLLEDEASLVDLLEELRVVEQVALDLLGGEVDEHTSDLWGIGLGGDSFNVLVDELTNLVLVVGVGGNDSGEQLEAGHVVGVHSWVGVSEGLKVRADGYLSGLLSNDLLRRSHHGCAADGGVGGSASVVLATVVVLRSAAAVHVVVPAVVGAALLLATVVVVVVIATLVVGEAATHLLLDQEEDLLDELDGVGSLEEGRVDGGSVVELSLGEEVSFVSGVSLLLLADLRELVVGDIEVASLE